MATSKVSIQNSIRRFDSQSIELEFQALDENLVDSAIFWMISKQWIDLKEPILIWNFQTLNSELKASQASSMFTKELPNQFTRSLIQFEQT